MKKFITICISLLLFLHISAQEAPMNIFDPLVGKTWKAEGKWSNGGAFKQETTFEYALNETIVLARSKGFTDQDQTQYGDRNFGIRSYNQSENTIEFTEYDVFGGVTSGKVTAQGNQIIYSYVYDGHSLADIWEYQNDSTYTYKVGLCEDGKLIDTYLETTFQLFESLND